MDLTKLLTNFENDSDFESGETASEEQIIQAEKELGIKFPNSYREILKRYGYLSWSGGDIFGISEDSYFNTVNRTNQIKSMKVPKEYQFPIGGNIISNYAGGGFYFLYGSESPKAGMVFEYFDETWWKPERQWSSIEKYIEDLSRGRGGDQ